jgi:hypothetical protein
VEVEAQEVPSTTEPTNPAPVSDPVGPQGSPPAPESVDPLDVPLPAPESPGAIAPGSGGPIFVPIAALLALLALAAPAILRRLGEVPAFRPSTPFVCALERPG